MLTRNEFDVLYCYGKKPGIAQRDVASFCDISLGAVNAAVKELKVRNLLGGGLSLMRVGMS